MTNVNRQPSKEAIATEIHRRGMERHTDLNPLDRQDWKEIERDVRSDVENGLLQISES